MYRILIADDEGIMLEALRTMISGQYGEVCELETAKTGRAVIEKTESFHPDIVFLDIHMPGINGIQAMKEIRKFNSSALFYIISAYDKFDYAKEAIDMGVEKYLTKPISRKTVLAVVQEAMEKVDRMRAQRSTQLQIREKLEIVIPVVENSFINSLLFQSGDTQDAGYYRQLLDITADCCYVMVVQFGTEYENGRLVSPIGMNLKAQDFYPEFRSLAKAAFSCIVGPLMSNRIVLLIPRQEQTLSYEERSRIVEQARTLAANLEEHLEPRFRIGIGRNLPMEDVQISYREALRALNGSHSRVIHIEDLRQNGVYSDEFPAETERRLFRYMESGSADPMMMELNSFFDWMVQHHPDDRSNICLKVLEYIIWAEKLAFEDGAVNYSFSSRRDYLPTVLSFADYESLRQWFAGKMTEICRSIRDKKEAGSTSAVQKAKAYILEHYSHDISLDDVSRSVNISPYYFSKVFKEESGENFIEYLTRVRIEKAKEMLENPQLSIKAVSSLCGYSDPNYFSRIFKKQTDMTPREYRLRFRNPGASSDEAEE